VIERHLVPFGSGCGTCPGNSLGTHGDVEGSQSGGEGFHIGAGRRRDGLAV
jgi:hypothetical protein